jgi:hypothetical protein
VVSSSFYRFISHSPTVQNSASTKLNMNSKICYFSSPLGSSLLILDFFIIIIFFLIDDGKWEKGANFGM